MKDLRRWVRAAVCSYQVYMHLNHVARYLNTDSKTFSIQRKWILWVSKQIYIHGSPKRLNLTSRSLAVVTSRLMWGMELSRRPIIFNLVLAQRQSKQWNYFLYQWEQKMHDNSQEMDGVLQWQKQKLQRQKFPLEYFAPRRWAKRKLGKLTIVNYHLLRRSAGVQWKIIQHLILLEGGRR